MRTCFLLVTAGLAVAAAQSTATTYTTDINGNRLAGGQTVTADGLVTDLRQSINGREVPLAQVEQKTLSQSGNTTVTERIIRHYGPGGAVVLTERVVTEETKTADGGSTAKSTTYRSDISGNIAEDERKTVETHKSGAATVTDTAIEKKSLSGGFELAEKRTATSEPVPDGSRKSETLMLRYTNGNLYEAQRSATTETTKGNETITNTAIYEPTVNGQLTLTRQNVTKSIAKADGSSTEETEIFGRSSDGRAHQADAPPALTEKRVTSREKGPGGAVVEKQTVQLPSVNDPGRLDPAHTVSETICRGECAQKP